MDDLHEHLLRLADESMSAYSNAAYEVTFDCKECPDGIVKVQWQDGQEIPFARCSHCSAMYTVTLEGSD